MKQLEEKLDELLVKKAPFQIPENGRLGVVKAMPYITLVGGILMLLAAWYLYQAAVAINDLAIWANSINAAYGLGYTNAGGLGFLVWVALLLLAVEAVLFFIAYPALKARQKKGWNILFWVTLLNTAEALVQVLANGNPGSLIMSLLGTVLGLYVLFQIRSYYTGAAKVSAGPAPSAPKETPAEPKPEDKQE